LLIFAPHTICDDIGLFAARKESDMAAVTEPEIYATLNEVFRELFADDGIVLKPETTADDIEGWDSFNHLNIIVAVESRFGIRLNTREIEGLTNVGDMVRLIQAKLH
jgi:acyl carrier protein